MNIEMTENNALWERAFRKEFCKQNTEVNDISCSDMSGICSYQKEKHNSLKCTLPCSEFLMENSSSYQYPRLNISNGNKGSVMFESGDVFDTKNLDSRSCIECNNPDLQMADSDEKDVYNFIEHSDQKICNNYEIGVSGDVNSQEIGYDYNFPQKTILNENNLEGNVYIDYDNHNSEDNKDNVGRATKRRSKNANNKSNLDENSNVAKLPKMCVFGNKSQLHINDYPIQKMEGGISSRLRSRDGIVGVSGSSIRNSKVQQILNYSNPYDATKRKSKNANYKSNFSKKRNRTKSQKICVKNNKSQLHADNYPMQEVEGGISCKLGSINSIVGISGSSFRNSKIPWISNYGQTCDVGGQKSKNINTKSSLSKNFSRNNANRATKQRIENANNKSDLNENCDEAKQQKTYIEDNKSQLHIDNHMTFEVKRDSSCVLGSTNVVVKISGPSVTNTTVLWT